MGSLFLDSAYIRQTIKIQGAPPNTVTGQTFNGAACSQRRLHISCPVGFEEQIRDSYLVRSFGGDIILVRRLSIIADTQTFRVIQLLVNESEAKWVFVVSISGDEFIFILGFSSSSAVSFSNTICKRSKASNVLVFSGMPDCYYTQSKDGVCLLLLLQHLRFFRSFLQLFRSQHAGLVNVLNLPMFLPFLGCRYSKWRWGVLCSICASITLVFLSFLVNSNLCCNFV